MQLTPADDQIDLWYTPFEKVADAGLIDQYQALLPDDESARARRFVFHGNRMQFLVARALLRTVLSRYCNVPPTRLRFRRNEFGKPAVAGPVRFAFGFNLSHTGGLAVCAIARGCQLGVDAERLDRQMDFAGVARRFFSRAELEHLESVPPRRQPTTFFRIWTLKEAFTKACGPGLSMPLAGFSIVPTTDRPPAITMLDDSLPGEPAFQFAQIRLGGQTMIAVCTRRCKAFPMRVRLREFVPLQRVFRSVVLPVDRGLLTG